MNSKQQKTLNDIFSEQRKSINWDDIEKLMFNLGAKIKRGRGSRGTFTLCGETTPFHSPHPQKEAKPYQIQQVKKFLIQTGIIKGEANE